MTSPTQKKPIRLQNNGSGRAKAEGLAYLCLAEDAVSDDLAKWEDEEALKHLADNPAFDFLFDRIEKTRSGQHAGDGPVTPRGDGGDAVAPPQQHAGRAGFAGRSSGAAREHDNRELSDIEFKEVPVDDEALAEIGRRSGGIVGGETLSRLRELRDLGPPPAAARAPAPTGPFVFLSYAHTDQPAASRLKSALEEEGLSIWWDQMIDPGMDWDAELRRRVTSAHNVLVLWSEASAASEHVRDEAQRARRADTIAPVMIQPLSEDQLPQPFGGRHTLDLSQWNGARDDEVFRRLVQFLKLRQIGAQSPVTTRPNDEGLQELAERPVGVAPVREDEVKKKPPPPLTSRPVARSGRGD